VDPWDEYNNFPNKTPRDKHYFHYAVIEIKHPGRKIEESVLDPKTNKPMVQIKPQFNEDGTPELGKDGKQKIKTEEVVKADQGWAWDEVDALRKGEPEWDALRLLAVFLTHRDNKAPNQRLVCN